MRIGQLRDRIQILRRVTQVDELGQPVEVWSVADSAWADVRYLGGLETIRANREGAQVQASVRLRYRADITPALRVQIGGLLLDIEAVLPCKGRAYLDLVCKGIP